MKYMQLLLEVLISYNRSEILSFNQESSVSCVSEDGIMVFSDRDLILIYLMTFYCNTI